MKLLALFGLALAVIAIEIEKAASDDAELPMRSHQLGLFKADPNNPHHCLKVLSMVYRKEINLAENPEVIFPLVRYCLETDMVFFPRSNLEVSVVHAAAIIFMFRATNWKISEAIVEPFYNAAMERHFPEKFKEKLHELPYTQNPLQYFESLENPTEQSFFMLWTVQMYGRALKDQSARQKGLLEDSCDVAYTLFRAGFPIEPLATWMIVLEKKLPVGTTLDSLSNLQLMFLSLTKSEYSRLRIPEKIQLRAFLEKYLIFRWKCRGLPAKGLSDEELEQFKRISKSEGLCRAFVLKPCIKAVYAGCLYDLVKNSYPAFLLKSVRLLPRGGIL